MSDAFVLAHLSDPHLPPPAAAAQLFPLKRLLARVSWRRRRRRMLRPIAEAIATDVAETRPDHVAVTGDLTSFGLDAEFEAGADWLGSLGPPDKVSFTPGNHDALAAGDWTRGEARLEAWTSGDDGRPGFPYLRRREFVALIAVSSAVPTPPGFASGLLSAAQIATAERLLDEARGQFRILLIHHPVGDGCSRRKALGDRGALRDAIGRAGVELVLHGHTHRAELERLQGRDGIAIALGCPSAAMTAAATASGGETAAAWRALRIEPIAEGWRVEAQERAVDIGGRMDDRTRLVFKIPRVAGPGPRL